MHGELSTDRKHVWCFICNKWLEIPAIKTIGQLTAWWHDHQSKDEQMLNDN